MSEPKRDEYDWIETMARLGGAVGMNPVRIRWKLRAWQDRQKDRGRQLQGKAQAVKREHKICPVCNGINAVDDKKCAHCGSRLRTRQGEIVARFFRQFGMGLGFETLLAGAFIAAYLLVVSGGEASTLWSLDSTDLVTSGGNALGWVYNVPMAQVPWRYHNTLPGQPWRLWTYAFLHGGLMHLAFNTWALIYIAPRVREVFGTNKALVVYLLSGLAAGAASLAWAMASGSVMVSIGASGALCGFIGLMMVWGHQDGTMQGIGFRNAMARWVLYIVVFGFLVGADHAAHIGGLVVGGLLAVLISPNFRRGDATPWRIAGVVAGLACAAGLAMVAFMTLG
jgi:membrane associated rhomboid family serine protease